VRPTAAPSAIPVIQSKLAFAGANATAFSRPEKVQEIVTNLGCVLRIALEQIVIRNITWIEANGRRKQVPFDPAVAALKSNGSTDCFVKDTSSGRMLRALQATSTGNVEVDYAITDPPATITSLDSASFSAIVENSPTLQNFAASVGSTSVSAPAPAELAITDSTNAIVGNTAGIPLYGIILASIAGMFVAGGAIFSVLRAFNAARATSISKAPQAEMNNGRVVQVVYLSNPLEAKSSTRRMDFVPMKIIGPKKS
jgi:hypothetical protein